ncbi:outer membrane protein [Taklimakanibacter deserti]|uniref:outer membrane protein n=1 Tax=Taklimakanibacter deserti TaxID=2267839 RepID=UPI000E65C9AF
MRKVLLSAVSIASLGLALSVAQAADVIPEPVAAPTWTGFHIGVGGGAGYNTYDANSLFEKDFFDDEGEPQSGGPEFTLDIDGNDLGAWYGFGTVEIGFDVQFDNSPIVLGILANYDFNGNNDADASSTFDEDDDDDDFSSVSSIKAEIDDTWFVGGRAGVAFNEDTLIYALGGYTWAKGKVEAFHAYNDDDDDDAALFEEDESVDGWTVGGGIEHMLTENLSLKVEYRHDFLDSIEWDEKAFDPEWGVDEENRHSGEVDFGRDTVRAVISWRFNPFDM